MAVKQRQGIAAPAWLAVSLQQLVLSLSLSAGLGLLTTWQLAYSFACGCLLHVLPQAYMAALSFRYRGARSSNKILQSFKRGMLGKFVLTMMGFAFIFAGTARPNEWVLFTGYLVGWFGYVVLMARKL